MKRREFLSRIVVGGGALTLPSVAKADTADVTIENAILAIERLESMESIQLHGTMNAAQMLRHCAKSIELNIDGYPILKSEFFRSTLGSVVFAIFSLMGKVIHNTDDGIPGVTYDKEPTLSESAERLKSAFFRLKETDRPKSHFFYGQLSKDETIFAQVAHFFNHLEKVENWHS